MPYQKSKELPMWLTKCQRFFSNKGWETWLRIEYLFVPVPKWLGGKYWKRSRLHIQSSVIISWSAYRFFPLCILFHYRSDMGRRDGATKCQSLSCSTMQCVTALKWKYTHTHTPRVSLNSPTFDYLVQLTRYEMCVECLIRALI
ncbi:Uncharacterized protein APZ42_021464 [Daphnia magna]|uniref:Uncharacterized protein n=1 Tax=Daphnia magna TaxID=35525 RepID=A0A0P6CM50_9CRUS|nr:Uncharacterized protein APZ42_021464 [Daphnia magna]